MGSTEVEADQFIAKDPRGYMVRCTKDQWRFHILSHHPEMAGWVTEIQAAIEKPALGIFRSSHDERFDLYYGRTGRQRPLYIKAAVLCNATTRQGELRTAFLVDAGSEGEKMIWPLLNP